MLKRLMSLVILLTVSAQAIAAGVGETPTTVTVTTASGNCLNQNNYRRTLQFDTTNATANIGYCQGAGCTAVIGAGLTTVIPSGTVWWWPVDSAPINAFCFIAASGSQILTIREGK